MKYQDTSKVINAHYVGSSVGTKLADELLPLDDGYDTVRSFERVGTVLQDAIGENPVPLEEVEGGD